MAERKVLNKYYPSDFDPDKLRAIEKNNPLKVCNVRMMMPMTIRCNTCGNYTYIGTKCNMKVEPIKNEDYLGITKYRFYYRCCNCYCYNTFKTDPKNNDYTAEIGGERKHERGKDMMLAEEEFKNNKLFEMKDDAMKNLEYRTYDSKREMDILEATDKVKELNRREAHIDFDNLIKKVRENDIKKEKGSKENINEKKEIEKMFKKLKKKEVEKSGDKNVQNKKEEIIEPKKLEDNLFLKKKVKREENELKDICINDKRLDFLDDNNSDKSEEEKNIKNIFKKPLINFIKKSKKD